MAQDKNQNWFTKAIAEGSTKAVAFYLVKNFILPPVMPLMTIGIGIATGIPLFYIWIGFLASLALVFHWLLRMDEWLYKRRVENKISVSNIVGGIDVKDGGICIQLQLTSLADYPIDFSVSKFSVKLSDKVPLKEEKEVGSTIPPYGVGWKNSNPIKIEKPPSPGTLEGLLEYTISYGRFKNFKHSLNGKKAILAHFNDNGEFINVSWNDAT